MSYNAITTGEIRKILQSGDPIKVAAIDPEDLETFYENEIARESYTSSGAANLYAGICEKAVTDYKTEHKVTMFYNKAPMPAKKSVMERELEKFFGTHFFLDVTGFQNADQVIKQIEETMIEEHQRKCNGIMV